MSENFINLETIKNLPKNNNTSSNTKELKLAAVNGEIEKVKSIIENGVTSEVKNETLRRACSADQVEVVKLLLLSGANTSGPVSYELKLFGYYEVDKTLEFAKSVNNVELIQYLESIKGDQNE